MLHTLRTAVLPVALGSFALSFALLSGCDAQKKNETDLLTEESQALRAQLDERNRALEASENERRSLALRISELERQGTAGATGGGAGGGGTGFEDVEGATISVSGGQVTVAMEGDVLFDSGRTTLKSGAKRSLDEIARVLNSRYSGMVVSVEGHTDTDPIRRSGFKTNYHLGFERAFAVREYLITRGVSGDRIRLVSYGPNDPRGTKAQSRRVEVVVDQR